MPNFTSKNLENSCNVMKHPVTKCHCVRTVKAGTAMNRSKWRSPLHTNTARYSAQDINNGIWTDDSHVVGKTQTAPFASSISKLPLLSVAQHWGRYTPPRHTTHPRSARRGLRPYVECGSYVLECVMWGGVLGAGGVAKWYWYVLSTELSANLQTVVIWHGKSDWQIYRHGNARIEAFYCSKFTFLGCSISYQTTYLGCSICYQFTNLGCSIFYQFTYLGCSISYQFTYLGCGIS